MKQNERREVPKYQPPVGRAVQSVVTRKPPVERPAITHDRKPGEPARKPEARRMTDVTVKLPDALLVKLDALRDKHSGGLQKPGRSTVLRWVLEQHPD